MENVHPPRNGSSNGFDPDLLVIHSRIQGIRGLSDRRSVSPWSNGGGAVSTSVLRETFWKGGREEGRRAFAKEGGGEEAENRIDMRQVGGKGEGGRWARGRERSERGREGMEKEEEREGARLERGTQRVERGVGSGGELGRRGEEGVGKGGEGRQLQARSSVASGARERERLVGRGGREQCHGGQCLAGGCPSTCSLASLPDSALLSVSKAASTDGSSRDPLVSSSSSPRSDPTTSHR